MKSAWVDSDAKAALDHWAKAGVGQDLALRVYSTRLLGREPRLVLHGGGNTSVKARVKDLPTRMSMCSASKGLAGTWPTSNLPECRPYGLRRCASSARARPCPTKRWSALQRAAPIDPQSPNPSVETLLHAFMPHKFVDHTHATAVLSLIDQTESEALCAETFGDRLGFVPYVMPGFAPREKSRRRCSSKIRKSKG